MPTPEPHLPLRKASAQRLQQERRAGPRPLFAPKQHQVRGFNPSPVRPEPYLDNVAASTEHAFAGREEQGKRPFKPPLGGEAIQFEKTADSKQANGNGLSSDHTKDLSREPSSAMVPSSPAAPNVPSPQSSPASKKFNSLRSSKSLGGGLRGLRQRFSNQHRDPAQNRVPTPDSINGRPPISAEEEMRTSFRSGLTATSNSSYVHASSATDRSSLVTGNSSQSDFVKVYPVWTETERQPSMSVEDAIGMYADGFESAKPSMEAQSLRSFRSNTEPRPSSQPSRYDNDKPKMLHRRSQSAGLLDRFAKSANGELMPPPSHTNRRTSSQIMAGSILRHSQDTRDTGSPDVPKPDPQPAAVPRDIYGFKKISHHVTLEKYEAWERGYSEHVERRRKKWHVLMRSYGLATENPLRYPPKSDKIKRYVRKGIPPEWRGNAWFWYAGGPGVLAKEAGLYQKLLDRVSEGELTMNDREHIERDLHRTFPDNIRFKPDPAVTPQTPGMPVNGTSAKSKEVETPMLSALRRVLQAFAIHNPAIGYCQSLNFIAGLLLLFLDQDEEKAFILLKIVTSTHLPGTHGVDLAGANVDIAVLMTCIQDTMPVVWAKLDDKGGGPAPFIPGSQATNLPTISLATTAWFMSLFVGTLPMESVVRVWDCLFFEGSKTLFRVALAIFKLGEKQILSVSDPMEVFQLVQTMPKSILDINPLMELCFRRRGGFAHVSQELIERRRRERKADAEQAVASFDGRASRWKARLRGRTRI
ncbi:hypothetical protein MBLNU230_g3387t1 [Neophaeotheca triangularis]